MSRIKTESVTDRQERIPHFSQAVIRQTRVAVMGAGATANEVLKNLALMGFPYIFVADLDHISTSNLSRTVLFDEQDVGKPKAPTAAQRFCAMGTAHGACADWLSGDICHQLGDGVLRHVDLVINCVDNNQTRLWVSNLCQLLHKPSIDLGINGFDWNVFVSSGREDCACFACTLSQRQEEAALNRVRNSCDVTIRTAAQTQTVSTFTQGRGGLQAGIYAAGTHHVLPMPEAGCLLQDEVLNRTLKAVVDAARTCRWPAFDEDRGTGLLRHVLVRRGVHTGQVMVVLITASDRLPGSRNFVAALRKAAPWVTTVVHNCNPRHTSAVLGKDVRVLYGPGSILDTLFGLQFSISASSFYQVNPAQTEVLYNQAMEAAALTGKETVLDAYCGTGTIGLCALSAEAGQLIGVEQTPAAVKDAKANAARNGMKNARFFCADATQWMQQAAGEGLHPDVVFLDPPRAGSTPEFIAAVTAMAPKRIVYVSCDPGTLARDVGLFTRRGWQATGFQPVDLFPHTEHLETVCAFVRKN